MRESNKYQVLIDDNHEDQSNQKYIICNTKVEEFRAIQAKLSLRETANQVVLSSNIAQALQVQEGDFIRLISN